MSSLQFASLLLALLAAVLSLAAAFIRVPHMFNAAEWNESEGVDAVPNALKRQSKFAAWGGFAAVASAALQIVEHGLKQMV